eukprot:TRINITY_DN14585_c0_g1_i1.p5 TRINITY_DN14585_c0_g1~~TRINITY_DN14585_c0_g1_i1.p5  ORF type:complete len:163 (+),score=31.99 TRINITY_DN14585_c0_g1_i1:104-592(+)
MPTNKDETLSCGSCSSCTVNCADGYACTIDCSGSCNGLTVNCAASGTCKVDCSGDCGDIKVKKSGSSPGAATKLTCSSQDACLKGLLQCPATGKCELVCTRRLPAKKSPSPVRQDPSSSHVMVSRLANSRHSTAAPAVLSTAALSVPLQKAANKLNFNVLVL